VRGWILFFKFIYLKNLKIWKIKFNFKEKTYTNSHSLFKKKKRPQCLYTSPPPAPAIFNYFFYYLI
jgi:hypothetical protein